MYGVKVGVSVRVRVTVTVLVAVAVSVRVGVAVKTSGVGVLVTVPVAVAAQKLTQLVLPRLSITQLFLIMPELMLTGVLIRQFMVPDAPSGTVPRFHVTKVTFE